MEAKKRKKDINESHGFCLNHSIVKHFIGWACFTKVAMTGYSILTSHTIVGRVSCRLPTELPGRLKKYARLCARDVDFMPFMPSLKRYAIYAPGQNAMFFMLLRWKYAVFYASIIAVEAYSSTSCSCLVSTLHR